MTQAQIREILMVLKTSKEIATLLNYSQARINQVCRKLKLNKVGIQYVLNEDEVNQIKDELGKKQTGRPKKNLIILEKRRPVNDFQREYI